MRDLGEDTGFTLEELDDLPVVDAGETKLFDGDVRATLRVGGLRFVGGAGATVAQDTDDAVPAHHVAGAARFPHNRQHRLTRGRETIVPVRRSASPAFDRSPRRCLSVAEEARPPRGVPLR